MSGEITALARQDAGCERLVSVPGIGPIISSAAPGGRDRHRRGVLQGRDFAAWLGLVPKQMSTGDRTILGKISKRGNRYLRVLFVQAAWVVLIKPQKSGATWAQTMDRGGQKATASQCSCDCARQQAGADRLEPIDQGVQGAIELGILAGYPLVDVKVTLFDGSYHEVDSNEMAFKFAGSIAFKEAARKASPVLLEPVMAVEVTVPEEYMGVIIGDINSRRGRIEGMEHVGGSQLIKAIVPLKEMFGYVNDIRSSTQGRASYSMQFARYEEAPRMIADEIIGRSQGK